MNQHPHPREPVRPAVLSVARRLAALKDAARRLRRWPREEARPSLTAANRRAMRCSGRDGKTALQPNWKTGLIPYSRRTTHALQKPDIFTRLRQPIGMMVDILVTDANFPLEITRRNCLDRRFRLVRSLFS